MKRLILTALVVALLSPAAHAFKAKIRNNGGGDIVLTDRVCTVKNKDVALHVAVANHSSGLTIFGCWTVMDEKVYIVWKPNGDIYSYPYESVYEVTE
jgi:hypothetical protein